MTAAFDMVTILRARAWTLAKIIHADGTVDPYNYVCTLDLIEHPIADLAALEKLLRLLGRRRNCGIVRGKPVNPNHVKAVRRLLCPDLETGEASDDYAWFDRHHGRRFRARRGTGGLWLIRKRGEAFLRTFTTEVAAVADTDATVAAMWFSAAWPAEAFHNAQRNARRANDRGGRR